MLWMDKALGERHYAIHRGKTFFNELVNFITASPVIAIVFEGIKAVEVIRRTMRETDSAKAIPGTIRGDFGLDIQHNLVHGSDSSENVEKEIALFFSSEELFDYPREIDHWLS